MNDLDALRAQVAALEARLAAVTPPTPAPPPPPLVIGRQYTYTPATTKALVYVIAAPEFRSLGARGTRQLAVAVAVSRGDALPGAEVPADYEPVMRRLAAARGRGLSWRAALIECNLEVPDDGEILHQARVLRDGLPGLWDDVTVLLGKLQQRLPSHAFPMLIQKLKPLL